jgi:3-mercaptopyruvate sulfurtransferase SseA
MGLPKVAHLESGFQGWVRAEQPIERPEKSDG